jgi:hypothetical protein
MLKLDGITVTSHSILQILADGLDKALLRLGLEHGKLCANVASLHCGV